MSEPTDQNNTDPIDDKDLSVLYARGSTEQPSPALDQAILDKARDATRQQFTSTKDYSSWSQAFSVAAVLVVSVTLVTLVRQEAPEPTSLTSEPTIASGEVQQESLDSPIATMDSFSLEKDKIKEDIQVKKAEEAEVTKAQRQRREEGRVLEKRIAATPALPLQQKTLKQKAPAQMTPEQEFPAADAMSPEGKTISPSRMASGVMSDNALGSAQEGKSCDQLTEHECFTSAACTLTRKEANDGYQCRPAKDHCELLFRQSEGTRETCEAKTGCVFVPASCYCPPDVICVCGGGEPAQCQSREE